MTITKKLLSASLSLLLVTLTGCATMQDVVKAKQNGSEGTTQTYNVNETQAWEIAKTVFRWEGSDAIEEHKEQHYMLTSSGMNLVSYGAVMGAWIEPATKAADTKVTVVTKRRVAMNIATTLTESTFHRRFAQAVEIIHKGQPLPAEAP
jgi:hypothetical protein